MTLKTDMHVRSGDKVAVHDCSTCVAISASAKSATPYEAGPGVTLFLPLDRAREVQARLAEIIAEHDALEAARAQVKAAKEAA